MATLDSASAQCTSCQIVPYRVTDTEVYLHAFGGYSSEFTYDFNVYVTSDGGTNLQSWSEIINYDDQLRYEGLDPNTTYEVYAGNPIQATGVYFTTQKENWRTDANEFPEPLYALRLEQFHSGAMRNFADAQLTGLAFIDGSNGGGATFSGGNSIVVHRVSSSMFSNSLSFIDGSAWDSGAGDRVVIPAADITSAFGDSDFTIEMWIKPDEFQALQYHAWLCAMESGGNFFGISIAKDDGGDSNKGRLRLNWKNNSASEQEKFTANDAIELDKWHHVAVTFENGANQVKWYVNGVLNATVGASGDPIDSGTTITGDFAIGTSPAFPSCSADCWMNGFKMYDVVLTEEQVQQSMGKFLNWEAALKEQRPAVEEITSTSGVYFAADSKFGFTSSTEWSVGHSSQVSGTNFGQPSNSSGYAYFDVGSGAYDVVYSVTDLDGNSFSTETALLLAATLMNNTQGITDTVKVVGSEAFTMVDALLAVGRPMQLEGNFEMNPNGVIDVRYSNGALKLALFEHDGVKYSSSLKIPDDMSHVYINQDDVDDGFFGSVEWNYNNFSIGTPASLSMEVYVEDGGWHAFFPPFKRTDGAGDLLFMDGEAVTLSNGALYEWVDDDEATYGWNAATLEDIHDE